ncbi:MAG TPA: DegT/DnrJ/EryC1/StrS family aminotransferase [Terriglobia bacterium]|nr:DegT/DnrJ/EryC1/StrS family aminotransferase [Terriglobia bacterium]
MQLDRREFAVVRAVLASGHLREGRITAEFENEFARACGTRFAIAVNSGTAALFLAYKALLEPGGEIIVPDFTFAATATMAVAAGMRPVFADVDPETFTLSPAAVERCLTRRTLAIAPVHLYGRPADVSGLARLARRHKLRVIWDAAQAHGARFRGRDVGAFPNAVCYSFYPSKNMTTGEGGMITTSDAKLAEKLRLLRSHGEAERYRHTLVGYNFRLTDIAAALGRVQLKKLNGALRLRRRNARLLTQGLEGLPGIMTPCVPAGAAHAFCLYTISVDSKKLGMSRDDFQLALLRRGIQSAVHYPTPLHRQPIFQGYGNDRDFPVSTRLAESVLSLPVHPSLKQKDLKRIVSAVREVVEKSRRG